MEMQQINITENSEFIQAEQPSTVLQLTLKSKIKAGYCGGGYTHSEEESEDDFAGYDTNEEELGPEW